MEHANSAFLECLTRWPAPAQSVIWTCRTLFHRIAQENNIGVLDETLKWGQPSWRPRRARTGSTLRMNWSPASPDQMSFFVDCKTDLAARMATLYPTPFSNDGRRRLDMSLALPLPEQALAHLAEMTFTYHLRRPSA